MVQGGGQQQVVETGDHVARVLHQARLHQAVVQELLGDQLGNRVGIVLELEEGHDQRVGRVNFHGLRGQVVRLLLACVGLLLYDTQYTMDKTEN